MTETRRPMTVANSTMNMTNTVSETTAAATTTTQSLVDFNQNAAATGGTWATMRSLPADMARVNTISDEQTLYRFLERPQVIGSGDLSSANPIGAVIASWDFPDILLSKPMVAEKVSGFQGLLADVEVKVQVNPNPFQQGRYMLVFHPNAQQFASEMVSMRLINLTSITQLPRVELSFDTHREMSMTIPYIAPTMWYNLKTSTVGHGRVYLVCYSSLETGAAGETTCQYTAWANFKNIQLFNPTTPGVLVEDQSVSEKEVKHLHKEPIESLELASEALRFAEHVPLLSSVAKPVSWALAAVRGAATAFGFSSPYDTATPLTMGTRPAHGISNSDTVVQGSQLGVFATNKVEVLPGFAGTDEDEMSLPSILKRYAWFTTLDWLGSDLAGTRLASFPLRAETFQSTGDVGGTPVSMYTPCAWALQLFKFTQASFRLKFKVVKTRFHSGRLAVVFFPGLSSAPLTPDLAYLEKTIIDLTAGSEFEKEFPFVSHYPLRSVNDIYGAVGVYVINELRSPETASPDVRILVEAAASPTSQVGVVQGQSTVPVLPIAVAAPVRRRAQLKSSMFTGKVEDQSGALDADIIMSDPTIGTAVRAPEPKSALTYCIGEDIRSLAQLVKRPSITFLEAKPDYALRPFTIGLCQYQNATYDKAAFYCDWVSVIGACYAYGRGSMRIHCFHRGQSGKVRLSLVPTTSTVTPAVGFDTLPGNLTPINWKRMPVTYFNSDTAMPTVQIPQYTGVPFRLNRMSTGEGFVPAILEPLDPFAYTGMVVVDNDVASGLAIMRSGGDDFQYGFWLGVPPYGRTGVPND